MKKAFGITIYENKWYGGKSSNIGDYVQTLAQINIYKKMIEHRLNKRINFNDFFHAILLGEYEGFKFEFVERDNLTDVSKRYSDYEVHIVMNGWYMHGMNEEKTLDWPPPSNIIPHFISFHVSDQRMFDKKYKDFYLSNQPIGCRDNATSKKFNEMGVNAKFTGCLTSTIDFFQWDPQIKKTAIIDVNEKNLNLSTEEYDKYEHMICKDWDHIKSLKVAYELLEKYTKYEKVITSRLHAFLPCLSLGVPSEFVDPSGDTKKTTWRQPNRFDGLHGIDFNGIVKLRALLYDRIAEIEKNIYGKS